MVRVIGVGRCPQTGYKVLISEPGWKPRGLGPSGQKLKPRALNLVKNKAAQQKGPENLEAQGQQGFRHNPKRKNEKLGSEVPCIQVEICQRFLFSHSGSSIYRSIWAGAFLILLGTAHRSGLQYSQHFATFHNISQRYQRWLKYISLTCSTAWLTCSTGSTGHKLWSSSCMVLSWKAQNITIQIQVAGILFKLEVNIQTTLNSSSPKPRTLRYLPRDGRVITPRRKVLIFYHGLTTPHDQHLVNKARLQKLIEWNAKLER